MGRTRNEYLESPAKAVARAAKRAIGKALLVDDAGMDRWVADAGSANLRAVEADGRVVGGCVLLPVGQWFGGRRVSMLGVAGVGIAPDARARGAATHMMREVVREAARRKFGIATLFPATQPVYRAAGWEQAGARIGYALAIEALDPAARDLEVTEWNGRSSKAIERLYAAVAAAGNGWVDRDAYFWQRHLRGGSKGDGRQVYLFGPRRAPEGWAVVMHRRRPNAFRGELLVTDCGFATPRAGRRFLSFAAAYLSVAQEMVWTGGPADPLLALTREQEVAVKTAWRWMVRITDVRTALTERGYPDGLEAEVAITVEDPLVAANRGTWVLHVKNGRGRVTKSRVERPDALALDVRTLAPIWTGWQTPREVRRWDRVEGPDATLDAVAAVFAGPVPAMRELF